MILTGTPAKRSTTDLEQADLSLEELTSLLGTYVVGEKDGPAIIPAIFRPCTSPCRNHERDGFIDCGGGALHRLKDNVEAVTGFGADLDDIPQAAFAAAVNALRQKGLRFWCWNTHSHVEGSGVVRARLLIPFDKPLKIPSAKAWSHGAWPNLAKWLGLDGAASADHACRDPSRIYYLPRKPKEESPHEAVFVDGVDLDVEGVLGKCLEGYSRAAVVAPAPAQEDLTRPVDLEDFKDRLRSIRKDQTKTLISRALRGEPLTPPPGQRKEGEPSRYIAWRQLTGALAAKAEDWESSKAILSLVRASHTAEANESPHDHTEWDTIEHLLETARAGIPQLRAEWEAQRAADRDMFLRLAREHADRQAEGLKTSGSRPETLDPGAPPQGEGPSNKQNGTAEEPFDWTEGLQMKETDSHPAVESCPANVEHVLRHHPAWAGAFRFNALTREVELHGGPLGFTGTLKDNHAGLVADWLSRDSFLNMRIRDHVVWSRILIVAEANTYDPLRDYLQSQKWDGTERLSSALVKYFGAPTTDEMGRDISAYVSTIFRRWAISAVARALDPGCKVDTVLHLEGRQGVGKSTALKILGGEFFSETAIDIHSKDSWAACGTNWIIELGELETFRRSEVSAQKRFFALCEDQYRPPYGRAAIRAPRRCVFVGTTNTDDYLSDPTGNRRHWPVRVERIDLEGLRRDRDQLWAEAVAKYRQDEQWYLTDAEAVEQEHQAEMRRGGDAAAEAILSWWLGLRKDKRPTEITTYTICANVLNEPPTRGLEVRIGNALVLLGFLRKRREINGHTQRYYAPSEELLSRGTAPAPSATQLIAQARGIGLRQGGALADPLDGSRAIIHRGI